MLTREKAREAVRQVTSGTERGLLLRVIEEEPDATFEALNEDDGPDTVVAYLGFSKTAESLSATPTSLVDRLPAPPDKTVYRGVTIWAPTYEEGFKPYKFGQLNRSQFEAAMAKFSAVAVLPADQMLSAESLDPTAPLEDVLFASNVPLEDYGQYYVVNYTQPYAGQLSTLEGWRRNMVSGMENAAAERLLLRADELGFSGAHRDPKKKRVFGSESTETDSGVQTDTGTLLAECKTLLDALSAKLLCRQIAKIKLGLETNCPDAEIYRGKQLLGFLFGQAVTTNAVELASLTALCKQMRFEVLLPNGHSFSTGDGCTPSPFIHEPAHASSISSCQDFPDIVSCGPLDSGGSTGGTAGSTGGTAGSTGGTAGSTGGSTGGTAGSTGGTAGSTGGKRGGTGGTAGKRGGAVSAERMSQAGSGSSCSSGRFSESFGMPALVSAGGRYAAPSPWPRAAAQLALVARPTLRASGSVARRLYG